MTLYPYSIHQKVVGLFEHYHLKLQKNKIPVFRQKESQITLQFQSD